MENIMNFFTKTIMTFILLTACNGTIFLNAGTPVKAIQIHPGAWDCNTTSNPSKTVFINSQNQTSYWCCPSGKLAYSSSSSTVNSANGQITSVSSSASQPNTCGCPPGTFNNNITCSLCTNNSYTSSSDSTSCTSCGSAQVVNSALTGCVCPAGNFINSYQNNTCMACFEGYSTNPNGTDKSNMATNQNNCVQCAPGFFSTGTGNTQCTLCPKGSYQGTKGQNNCAQCPAGTFTPVPSSSTPNILVADCSNCNIDANRPFGCPCTSNSQCQTNYCSTSVHSCINPPSSNPPQPTCLSSGTWVGSSCPSSCCHGCSEEKISMWGALSNVCN